MKGFRSDDIVGFSDDESMFVVGNLRTVRVWDTSTWERIDIKMGMDPGCTRVSTKAFPDEPLVHVLSFALWFDMNKSIDRYCYTPLDAVGLAASSNYSNLIFRLNRNGKLWAWNLNERVYVDQKNDFTYEYNQNPEVLLALSYAGQAMIKVDPNKDVRLVTFPNTSTGIIYHQDDYGVKAAISDEARLIAFGSKYGTITLWAKP
jgi:WD40 repeat protein